MTKKKPEFITIDIVGKSNFLYPEQTITSVDINNIMTDEEVTLVIKNIINEFREAFTKAILEK